MIWIMICLLIAAGFFFSAFFSGSETGLYCANRVRLQLRARVGDPQGLRVAAILADEPGTLLVTLIGVNVADYVSTGAAAYLFDNLLGLSQAQAEVYTICLVAPVVFVFANVVAKNLYQLHADTLMLKGSGLLFLSSRVLRYTGTVWLLKTLAEFVDRLTRDPLSDARLFDPRRKIALLLQESLAGRAHSADQSELIDRVLQLSEMSLQSVMVSASRVTAIPTAATRNELLHVARTTTYSRVPVYGLNRRTILGVVHIDELLADDDWMTVGQRMDPVIRLGLHETVASAIGTLQSAGGDMGIVAEENGPMQGIVTMRTLLELLVGGLAIGD